MSVSMKLFMSIILAFIPLYAVIGYGATFFESVESANVMNLVSGEEKQLVKVGAIEEIKAEDNRCENPRDPHCVGRYQALSK